VLMELSDELTKKFVEGYQVDNFFKDKWSKATTPGLVQFKGQAYQADERGLLYLRVDNDPPKLCVPHTMVPYILNETHDSPLASAHEG
ncbi:hypothetical protein DAEQUDRAFT_653672, partial [Daedalea quercina L-15889]